MGPDSQLSPFFSEYLKVSTNGGGKEFATKALDALKVLLAVCRSEHQRGLGGAGMSAIRKACDHLLESQNAAKAGIPAGVKLTALNQTLVHLAGNAAKRRRLAPSRLQRERQR